MLVSRVLMCRPTHFDVEYVINPHMMPHSVDRALAITQWQSLVSALENLHIKVEIIDQQPGVPDMVFATDEGIVRDGKIILANFRFLERKLETHYYREWFKAHGYEIIDLTNIFSFEGGDTLFFGDILVVGTGFRANVASCEELSLALNADVIPLRLVDPRFYHLDMCFFPLSANTAFYFPPAFSDSSAKLLASIVPNLHELTRAEVEGYSANSYVTGYTVITQVGNESFTARLKGLGKTVVELDMSEFKKAGGGIHCLINTLEGK